MGWWQEAAKVASDGISVIGTQNMLNEGVLRGEHSTHTFFRRSYVEEQGLIDGTLGKVLCEEYVHEFVDNEAVETAKSRGVFSFCHTSVVEHLHPNAGKATSDSMYEDAARRTEISYETFAKRRHLWATT